MPQQSVFYRAHDKIIYVCFKSTGSFGRSSNKKRDLKTRQRAKVVSLIRRS